MVAYYLLLVLVVGALFWLFFSFLRKFLKEKAGPEPATVEEKKRELGELRHKSDELVQEIAVTEDLVEEEWKVDSLADRLDEVEGERMSKEDEVT